MDYTLSTGDIILASLSGMWAQIIGYLPSLIAGLLILLIGIFLAKAIEKIIVKIIAAIKLDEQIQKTAMAKKMEQAGSKVVFSQIIGWLVKWFLYIVILVAVSQVLQLGQFTIFLQDIAMYLPNVIIAVLILTVGFVLGYFVEDLIVKILKTTKAKLAGLAGTVAKWAIIIFAFLAALIQLNVAVVLIQTLFTAIMVTLALAAGLAFGLGGKDAAADVIDKVRRNIKD